MTATSAHDLTVTRDCKIEHCPWDAEDSRGRYAGLCRDHKRAVIAADTEQRLTRAHAVRRPAEGRIIAAAQQVLAASRKLEVALDGVYKAELRREAATVELRTRIAVLIATTKLELENDG